MKQVQRVRAKLDTPSDVRNELAKIYRRALTGDITVDEHSKFANTLQIILRTFERKDSDVE